VPCGMPPRIITVARQCHARAQSPARTHARSSSRACACVCAKAGCRPTPFVCACVRHGCGMVRPLVTMRCAHDLRPAGQAVIREATNLHRDWGMAVQPCEGACVLGINKDPVTIKSMEARRPSCRVHAVLSACDARPPHPHPTLPDHDLPVLSYACDRSGVSCPLRCSFQRSALRCQARLTQWARFPLRPVLLRPIPALAHSHLHRGTS
jgi:hypothetical protein